MVDSWGCGGGVGARVVTELRIDVVGESRNDVVEESRIDVVEESVHEVIRPLEVKAEQVLQHRPSHRLYRDPALTEHNEKVIEFTKQK